MDSSEGLAASAAALLMLATFTVRVTPDIPSMNLVRNSTFALLNMPSLSDTMINCELVKWAFSMLPMFCVWERSSAASTSSRMYSGAGLYFSMARMSESATSERCPPLSSVSDSFHIPLKPTFTSSPFMKSTPSGGTSRACVPGSSVLKMLPKFSSTSLQATFSFFFFSSSRSVMIAWIFFLSSSTTFLRRITSLYCSSSRSSSTIAFWFTFRLILSFESCSFFSFRPASCGSSLFFSSSFCFNSLSRWWYFAFSSLLCEFIFSLCCLICCFSAVTAAVISSVVPLTSTSRCCRAAICSSSFAACSLAVTMPFCSSSISSLSVSKSCSSASFSCSIACIRLISATSSSTALPFARAPPDSVPPGSTTSPSSVTERVLIRGWNVILFAISRFFTMNECPKANCIAWSTSGS
uniref:Secreted protein n=1 Tax=Anopheles melas TaxID=34690 RepID=A0A182U059_9DIPT